MNALHITLRRLVPNDAPFLCRLENTADVMLQTPGSEAANLSQAEAFIVQDAANEQYTDSLRLVISMERDGQAQAVGLVDLTQINDADQHAEVGIAILPEWRRQGVATAALRLVERLAVSLSLHTLIAHVSADNQATIALFQQADYKLIGTLPQYHYAPDGWHDVHLFHKILSPKFK